MAPCVRGLGQRLRGCRIRIQKDLCLGFRRTGLSEGFCITFGGDVTICPPTPVSVLILGRPRRDAHGHTETPLHWSQSPRLLCRHPRPAGLGFCPPTPSPTVR